MARVVCVTGMHRSGTSLTAAWLAGCGLPLSGPSMIGAGVGNESGHYEDREFVSLHRTWIRRRVADPRGWVVTSSDPLTLGIRGRRWARKLVRARNRRWETWGWKDPRSALFLEDWRALVPDLTVLALWRPRKDVVDSLLRRATQADDPVYHISRTEAQATWDAYNRAILRHKERWPDAVLLVPVDRLLDASGELFSMVSARLGHGLEYRPPERVPGQGRLGGSGAPLTTELEQGLVEASSL